MWVAVVVVVVETVVVEVVYNHGRREMRRLHSWFSKMHPLWPKRNNAPSSTMGGGGLGVSNMRPLQPSGSRAPRFCDTECQLPDVENVYILEQSPNEHPSIHPRGHQR